MSLSVSPVSQPLRMAIGQLQMRWTGAENTAAIVAALAQSAAGGARVCVFPELALTGFHRQIRSEAQPAQVEAWIAQVQAACATHAIAASVGSPTFAADGQIHNSNLFIDAAGKRVGVVSKCGLTPAEATFFAAGTDRPVHEFVGRRCSVVLCREIHDVEPISAQLSESSVDLIIWPGAMRPAVDGSEPDPDAHVKRARMLARRTGSWIVQANWPNALNRPEESEFGGQSVVVDSAGDVRLRLPVAAAGVGIFDLGARAFDWIPQSL